LIYERDVRGPQIGYICFQSAPDVTFTDHLGALIR
jgi:hypothetical protein